MIRIKIPKQKRKHGKNKDMEHSSSQFKNSIEYKNIFDYFLQQKIKENDDRAMTQPSKGTKRNSKILKMPRYIIYLL